MGETRDPLASLTSCLSRGPSVPSGREPGRASGVSLSVRHLLARVSLRHVVRHAAHPPLTPPSLHRLSRSAREPPAVGPARGHSRRSFFSPALRGRITITTGPSPGLRRNRPTRFAFGLTTARSSSHSSLSHLVSLTSPSSPVPFTPARRAPSPTGERNRMERMSGGVTE